MSALTALLVTADDALLDQALAVCAAAGVEPELAMDLGSARPRWTGAPVVMIGADLGEQVLEFDLPRRRPTLLLDVEGSGRDVAGLAIRLGAPVVLLPGGAAELTATLTAGLGRTTGGRIVAVVGGSGGIGASTLAAALAVDATRSRRRALLVDLDPLGGGIDLLMGAERVPGWRWPRLHGARGQLGDLSGHLPHLDGIDLVSMSRAEKPRGSTHPTAEALAAVVVSGSRSHDLVVVDVGRTSGSASAAVLRLADTGLLVVAADVRGVAAARETYGRLADACGSWHLLVRRPRSGGLSAADTADRFDPRMLAVIDDDPAIALAAQRGAPPAKSPRSQLAKVCRQVLDTVVWPGASAA